MVDELDESAKTWGAVNTVRFEGAGAGGAVAAAAAIFRTDPPVEIRSQGFNTDADGVGTFVA